MAKAGRQNSRKPDSVNRRKVLLALLPLLLTLILAPAAWYLFFTDATADRVYRMGAERRGSDVYELLEAIVSKTADRDSELRFEVFATPGSEENLKLLEDGVIDFASIPADAISRPSLSMIATLYPDTYHLIARRDANIQSVRDLVGKRVALPPQTSSEYRSFWFLIDQYTVQPERFRTYPMQPDDAFQALRQNTVDAIFLMRAPGDRRLKWLADAVALNIIEIDQAAAMKVKRAALNPTVIPKGVYSGTPAVPPADIASIATDRVLVTRSDVPDEVVRAVTSVLFENRRDLSVLSRLAGFVSQPQLGIGTMLPVHPGALAFYDRDQPSFFQENAEPIGVTISVLAILVSALLWLKRNWEERQKGRADIYNLDLLQITGEARAATAAADLDQLKARLFELLTQVVNDLDNDKIDGQGFQYFAFTWQTAMNAVTDRERTLVATAGRTAKAPALN